MGERLNERGKSRCIADGEYQIIKDAQQYSGKFRAFGDEWNGIYGLLQAGTIKKICIFDGFKIYMFFRIYFFLWPIL